MALPALWIVRSPMPSPPNSARIIRLPGTAAGKRLATLKRVRGLVEKKLFSLMGGLAFNVAEALFEEMYHLDEQAALECHFNIMRSLKTEAELLQDEMRSQMNQAWMALLRARDVQPIPDAPHDVTTILKRYSDKNLNHYKVLLTEVRLRFSNLAGRELSFHPMLPGTFYLSFWHATEHLALTYQERKIVLPLFNRFVMDRFGQILAISNRVLIDQNVPDVVDVE